MFKLIITLAALSSIGCASHPFNKSWEWGTKAQQDADYARISRRINERFKAQIREIDAKHPEWDKALLDDVLVVECVSNDSGTLCVGR